MSFLSVPLVVLTDLFDILQVFLRYALGILSVFLGDSSGIPLVFLRYSTGIPHALLRFVALGFSGWLLVALSASVCLLVPPGASGWL